MIAAAILEWIFERPAVTTTFPERAVSTAQKVYQPQDDSRLLVDMMHETALVAGRRVLDLCTGSGFVAIAAAQMGCASVTAFDICPHAVDCSRGNAAVAGVNVDVREGSWINALDCGPFDLVVSNPPYVPTPPVASRRQCSRKAPGSKRSVSSKVVMLMTKVLSARRPSRCGASPAG